MEGLLHIIQKILMQDYACFHIEDKESLEKELVSTVVWLMDQRNKKMENRMTSSLNPLV